MILPSTQLSVIESVLDPFQVHKTLTIEELFRDFIIFEKSVSNNVTSIALSDKNSVSELYGWTRIKAVISQRIANKRFYQVSAGEHSITVHESAMIPIYQGGFQIGFHGMRKYNYSVIVADKLRVGDTIRAPGDQDEFISVDNIKVIDGLDHEYVYTLWTNSGFYNANGILIYGGNLSNPILKGLN